MFWFAFLACWYLMAFNSDFESQAGFWVAVLFPVIHVAAGLCMVYHLISLHLNRTVISLDGTMLLITHGPLPGGKALRVPREEIAQLYFTEEGETDSYGEVTKYYELRMKDTRDRHRTLIKKLPSAAEALYIERYLEELLSIPNEAVQGEYSSA